MTRTLPEAFQPRVGLSSIFAVEDAGPAHLPDDSRLQPIDAAVEAQLRAMLQADTFDAQILGAVRPEAFDRTVLAPARFHALREEISARLAELRRHAGREAAGELDAALAVLRARANEHELGETLRYALLKG